MAREPEDQARPLPSDAARSLRLYRLAFPVVALCLLPGYLLRLIRRGNYRAHFGQRLGWYAAAERARLQKHRWTWIQSISVGETLVALKLARELHTQEPDARIVISTTTTTGFVLAQAERCEWLEALYNPIDLGFVVRRVVRLLRPERFIVIEGGIWPNLLAECHAAGLPLALANARLSPRSERRFRRFRRWVGPLFRLFDVITVPEPEDVARWASLSVDAASVQVTGSIKFDQPHAEASGRATEFRALLARLGVAERTPVIVAGSTFPGEEALLVQALLELRQTLPELFLIIVPRHVERTVAILRELSPLPARVARRTGFSDSPADVLLVDTTGELRDWYALATVAFIGKSITATGGQNPAEPAVLGVPVIFGPHMENFAALAQHLVASGAAVRIEDAAQLAPTLRRLLEDASARERMSFAGRTALSAHTGATSRAARFVLTSTCDTRAAQEPAETLRDEKARRQSA